MISLALPTYNGEKFLEAQLDSIYNQTMVPDEIVVVDDCSSDGTIKILEKYKQRCGLKYYVNDKNLGYNRNFEKAISLCNGDFIALCDQDDVWLPEKVEKSYNKIVEFPQNIPVLVSTFSSTNIGILETGKGEIMKGGDWRQNIAMRSTQGCTVMFNRKLKEEVLPIPDGIMYDAYLGFSASLLGNRFYIGEQLMYYRIHSDNSLAKKKRQSLFVFLKRNLQKHVPLWHDINRYNSLKLIRKQFYSKIPKHKLDYLDRIMSLYTTGVIKRIIVLGGIKEIPLRIRYFSTLLLLVKFVFRIKDKE